MSGIRGAKPRSAAAAAKATQRKVLDLAHVLYPGIAVKLVRNHRGKVHLDGVQYGACVLVRKEDDGTIVPLFFASSWVKLHELAVDMRRDRAREREREGASSCPE